MAGAHKKAKKKNYVRQSVDQTIKLRLDVDIDDAGIELGAIPNQTSIGNE